MESKCLLCFLALMVIMPLPAASVQYFYEDFTGDAGLWLGADLGWYVTSGGDMQVTGNTLLDNPAADGSTQVAGTMSRFSHGFTGAGEDVTYVLTAKVATTATSMDWGIGFGFGGADRVVMQHSSDGGGTWFFDLRPLGETYHYFADPGGYLGSILDITVELDEVNRKARAQIIKSPTEKIDTGWISFPNMSDAASVVIYNDRRSGQSGVDIDDISVFRQVAPGSLSGTVTLQNYAGLGGLAPVQIELIPQEDGAARSDIVFLTDGVYTGGNYVGNYSIQEVTPGRYNVRFSACKWLSQIVSGVVIPEGSGGVANASMPNGDLDGDNAVTTTDLSVAITSINLPIGKVRKL